MERTRNTTRTILQAIAFTVAVYAATVAIQIYQPATGGYFNLGEAVIYTAALTSSPLVAGIAGGVGAALADATTGYGIFAPGTLVIKFVEGVLAGILASRLKRYIGLKIGALTGALYSLLIIFFAITYFSGQVFLSSMFLEQEIVWGEFSLGWGIWIVIAVALGLLIAYMVAKNVYGGEIASLLLAGLSMVIGYFLYEYFISNPLTNRPPIDALFEIPVNMGQAVFGAAIAIPITGWLRKSGFATTR